MPDDEGLTNSPLEAGDPESPAGAHIENPPLDSYTSDSASPTAEGDSEAIENPTLDAEPENGGDHGLENPEP